MTKYIIAILCLFPTFANGDTMCVKDDTIMVVLDPEIGGGTGTYNNSARTWSVSFSYGTISGVCGCGPQNAQQSQVSETSSSAYRYYCKMLHPVQSQWVQVNSKTYNVRCITLCAEQCANRLSAARSDDSINERGQLFTSVQ